MCSSPVFLFMFCGLLVNSSSSCSKSSGSVWGTQPPSPSRGDYTEKVTGMCPWVSSILFHVTMSIFTLAPLRGWSLMKRCPNSFPNKTLCLCIWPHSFLALQNHVALIIPLFSYHPSLPFLLLFPQSLQISSSLSFPKSNKQFFLLPLNYSLFHHHPSSWKNSLNVIFPSSSSFSVFCFH